MPWEEQPECSAVSDDAEANAVRSAVNDLLDVVDGLLARGPRRLTHPGLRTKLTKRREGPVPPADPQASHEGRTAARTVTQPSPCSKVALGISRPAELNVSGTALKSPPSDGSAALFST